jgi:predicted component of type VI protein secretion system
MKLSLVVLTTGKMEGQVIPVTLAQFVIGRDPQCNLRPASPLISKRHCALIIRGEKVFLRDFNSTNGTLVNDQPIKNEIELNDRDRLKVGPLRFEVRIEALSPVDRPTPPPPTKKPADTPPPAPAIATTGSEDDNSIADMLLAMGDDGTGAAKTGNVDIPEGSTVMEIATVPPPDGEGKAKEDALAKAKALQANTSHAAKAILEKYMKRPRS